MNIKCFLILICFSFTVHAASNSVDSTLTSKELLKVGIKVSPPFVYENELGQKAGISIYLMNELATALGYEVQYKEYELEELIQAVESGALDMSVNPLTVTEERIKKMDFSQPFVISKLGIATKPQSKSQILTFIQNIFSLDFLKAVLLLFLVIFIFGLIIWAFERKQNDHFENNGSGLMSGIWFSAVTMTTVGYGDKAPVTNGGKFFTLIWMFTAIIIISGFTASIAASLTADKLGNSITELNHLKQIKVGTVAASSSETYLEKHNIKVNTFTQVEAGLSALSNNEIEAFVYDEPLMRFKLEEGDYDAKIQVLPYTFNTQYYSLSFPKNSELLDKVNPELLRIIKTDGWEELIEKYGLGE